MLLPQDGFNGGFRLRNVLHDEGIVIQYVTGGIIQPGVPKDQGGEHQDEQDGDQQQCADGRQYLPGCFPVFPQTCSKHPVRACGSAFGSPGNGFPCFQCAFCGAGGGGCPG